MSSIPALSVTEAPLHAGRTTPLESRAHLHSLLTSTHRQLIRDDIGGMTSFVEQLDEIRRLHSTPEWRRLISDEIAPHPIRGYLHEEPFTRRAFEKPRGYPGDAPMLDLVYRDEPYRGELTTLGAQLYAWTAQSPSSRSVRERRQILASTIDRVAADRPAPRILSLACGHLREAQTSEAVRAGCVAAFVAFDQDRESLAVIEREQRDVNVLPVAGSVRRFVAAPTRHGTFDLAYSAGLYDYLPDDTAALVTRALFQSLRPGGELVVANFAPWLRDIGYLEAIMDWHLVYRDEDAVARFTSRIPAEEIAELSIERDQADNVIYLTVRRS